MRQFSIADIDLQLGEADMTGVGLAPGRAMGVEKCRRPPGEAAPCGARQAGGARPVRFALSLSSGLVTSRIVLTATRV